MKSKLASTLVVLGTIGTGAAVVPATTHAAASWRSVGPALTAKAKPNAASWRTVGPAFMRKRCPRGTHAVYHTHRGGPTRTCVRNKRAASFMRYTRKG